VLAWFPGRAKLGGDPVAMTRAVREQSAATREVTSALLPPRPFRRLLRQTTKDRVGRLSLGMEAASVRVPAVGLGCASPRRLLMGCT
jgi:hypothetical protein